MYFSLNVKVLDLTEQQSTLKVKQTISKRLKSSVSQPCLVSIDPALLAGVVGLTASSK